MSKHVETQIRVGSGFSDRFAHKLGSGDMQNHIRIYQGNGTFERKWGSLGSGNGQFNDSRGVAVTNKGEVLVTDRDNQMVQVFDLSPYGLDVSFELPWP